jgi:hypothetical protein
MCQRFPILPEKIMASQLKGSRRMASQEPTQAERLHPCPPHLAGLAQPTAERPATVSPQHWAKLLQAGWAGQLRAANGQTRFQIRFHGDLLDGLIVEDEAPALVYAVDGSGERILLFDGGMHGHNAMFCDEHDPQALAARRAERLYVDSDGEDTFEILIWVGHNIDWDEERDEHVDPDDPDMVALIDGRRMPFEVVRQAGFDAILIVATNLSGHATDVVQEELA